MNEIAPCKDCTERHTGCHGSCDKYKEWSERYHAQQEHLSENRYRWSRPWSASRERSVREHLKFSSGSHHKGGNNG